MSLEECNGEIIVPIRIVTGKSKLIVGPYRRLRKAPSYYLALGFMLPAPDKPRWELHILSDPEEKLSGVKGEGSILGYKAIVKHRCLHKLLPNPASYGVRGRIHVAPWGVPLLIVARVEPLPPALKGVMVEYGLRGAKNLLEDLAEQITVVEV